MRRSFSSLFQHHLLDANTHKIHVIRKHQLWSRRDEKISSLFRLSMSRKIVALIIYIYLFCVREKDFLAWKSCGLGWERMLSFKSSSSIARRWNQTISFLVSFCYTGQSRVMMIEFGSANKIHKRRDKGCFCCCQVVIQWKHKSSEEWEREEGDDNP